MKSLVIESTTKRHITFLHYITLYLINVRIQYNTITYPDSNKSCSEERRQQHFIAKKHDSAYDEANLNFSAQNNTFNLL